MTAPGSLAFHIDRPTQWRPVSPVVEIAGWLHPGAGRQCRDVRARVDGQVCVQGENVRSIRDVYQLRRRVGMVFPLPVGLPLSIVVAVTSLILIPCVWPLALPD